MESEQSEMEMERPVSSKKTRGRPQSTTAMTTMQETINMLALKLQSMELTMANLSKNTEQPISNFTVTENIKTPEHTDNKLDKLLEFQINSSFFQLQQSLEMLTGKEPTEQIREYFKKFEALTEQLDQKRKVNLLITKLTGITLTIYEMLKEPEQKNYECIKVAIVNRLCKKANKESDLFDEIVRKKGETLLELSYRIWNKTKECVFPCDQELVISNLAKSQFLKILDNPTIKNTLLLKRDQKSYFELVDLAIKMHETEEQTQTITNKPNPEHVSSSSFRYRENRTLTCLFCDRNHPSSRCDQVTTLRDRINRLKEKNRCLVCVRSGHLAENCTGYVRCSICSNNHSFLVCPQYEKNNTNRQRKLRPIDQTHISNSKNHALHIELTQPRPSSQEYMKEEKESTVLLKCIRCQVTNPQRSDHKINVMVLFDDGSTTSYITSDLMKKLKLLSLGKETMSISVFNQKESQEICCDIAELQLMTETGSLINIRARKVNFLTQPILHYVAPQDYRTLKSDYSMTHYQRAKPDILIGSDYYYQFDIKPTKQLSNGLMLLSSSLGFIIAGKTSSQSEVTQSSRKENITLTSATLNKQISRFFSLENLGITERPIEPFDINQIKNSIKLVDNRYEVSLPFKQYPPPLPDNYGLSLGRLRSTLKTLKRKPQLLSQYQETIQYQLDNNIIEHVPKEFRKEKIYYIPHQPVIKGDKVRIVYDASAKTSNHKYSLNDCLYAGPLLLNNLSGVLLRFRLYPIIIACDIEKAFLQVSLNREYRDYVRFLWVKDPSRDGEPGNLITYRFTRVAFGLTCSPFLLAITLINHFEKIKHNIGKEILNNLYVDNIMLGANCYKEAQDKCTQVKTEFEKIKMNVREFVSNRTEALTKISQDDKLRARVSKFLGLYWRNKEDQIEFNIARPNISKEITKQEILSYIASIFDPLGLLAPISLPYKLFFQDLWQENIKWEQPLNETIKRNWEAIHSNDLAKNILIKRHCVPEMSEGNKYELHAFADASKTAFACCVYLKTTNTKTISRHTLIFAKSKVCPKRYKDNISIHRLELLALLIAVRAVKFCQVELIKDPILLKTLSQKQYLWTDSTTVIHWLNSKTKQETFVENRLIEISKTPNLIIRYVKTSENPADIASRGCTMSELKSNHLWWEGPNWISSNNYPTYENIPEFDTDNSRKFTNQTLNTISSNWTTIKVERFSKWHKLLHTFCFVTRFIKNTAKSTLLNSKLANLKIGKDLIFLPEELNYSKYKLFEIAQQIDPPKSDEIKSLQLYRDTSNLWRSRGRINNSLTSNLTKEPIWLPAKSKYTELYVIYVHLHMIHASPIVTLNNIRLSCWIPQGRRTVTNIIKKSCLVCRRMEGPRFTPPSFPNLPPGRVQPSASFAHTGVDYLGPLKLKNGKKIWIAVFTCMVIRAIHLEVVNNLSTETFICALRRFVSRRGKPVSMTSDNGKQFVLAKKLVDPKPSLKTIIMHDLIRKYMSEHGIKWNFITERAPWKGGFYERLIGLVKRHIFKIFNKVVRDEESLHTYITEIEFMVNCRPITYSSDQIQNPTALRPIDLLSPNINTNVIAPFEAIERNYFSSNPSNKVSLTDTWIQMNKQIELYWQVWSKDYLLALREQNNKRSHNGISRLPRVNELVLVQEDNLPRSQWRLATIQPDQIITKDTRSLTIRYSNGRTTKRSVIHLYPLEASD